MTFRPGGHQTAQTATSIPDDLRMQIASLFGAGDGASGDAFTGLFADGHAFAGLDFSMIGFPHTPSFVGSTPQAGPGAGAGPIFPTLDGQAPVVVGHRGAAGVRLEETLEGYRYAIQQGADFVEPDVVPTKDGVLIARHEPELGSTTDIAEHPEFADRYTTKMIDGAPVSGWFAEDLTLAEVKTLYARERIPEIRPQNTQYDGQFRVATLSEVIDVVKQAEIETGRQVGLIPETKHPTYFKYEGTHLDGTPIHMDTSQMLVDNLVAEQFTDPSRVIIQSFEVANLIDLQTRIMPAAGIDAQLFQLLNEGGYDITFNFDPAKASLGADPGAYQALDYPITAESVTNNDLYNPAALKAMHALYAEAIGPYKDDILPAKTITPPVDGNGDGVALIARQYTGTETSLVADAHAAGLKVIPYTLRDDEAFQTLNADGSVPAGPTDEYLNLIAAGVDGFFTDFPGTGRQVVDQLVAEASPSHPGGGAWHGDVGRPTDLLSVSNP